MQDLRADPVTRLAVIGESNAFGMCAIEPRHEWVQVVADLLREHQDEPLRVFNRSIPANVMGPRSPGHGTMKGTQPSALERYRSDLIALQPDLSVIAYGLNDSRCGYQADHFLEDLGRIIEDVKAETQSLIVILSPYWNAQHSEELGRALKKAGHLGPPPFDRIGSDLVSAYIDGMKTMAEEKGAVFVDVYHPLEGCCWLLNDDSIHYNDVGHHVLGQLVFAAIAVRCSFIGAKSRRQARAGSYSITSTGGTNCRSEWIKVWHEDTGWLREIGRDAGGSSRRPVKRGGGA